MSDYEVTESRTAYEGRLSNVRIDHVRMPDGATVPREVVEHVDAVAVVALDDDDQVLLLRQYRHPVRARCLELPAGILDVADEQPEVAARRELAEETGLAAGSLQRMVTFYNSAGWCEEATTVYLATGLSAVGAPQGFVAEHEESDMEQVRMPLAEAAAMAARGEIPDAKTLIGILLAASRLDVQP